MQTHLTVKGLVIRETAYGETGVIFDLLTDSGIRTVSAQGIRKAGSKYAAVVQIFTYGEFCLRQSSGRYYLDSAAAINQFYALRTELESLALASYFSELIRLTETDQPQPELLRLFLLSLFHLTDEKQRRPRAQVKAVFELRLITELGYAPNLLCCMNCLTYLPEEPVLRIAESDMICMNCTEELSETDIPVTKAALLAARNAVYADYEKLFAFRVSGESLQQFADYAERCLTRRIGYPLPTLKYYHALADMLPAT